jgi:hypothetical protein
MNKSGENGLIGPGSNSYGTDDNYPIELHNRVDLFSPAQKAIYSAMIEVEKLPASEVLTCAVSLLEQALGKVTKYRQNKI